MMRTAFFMGKMKDKRMDVIDFCTEENGWALFNELEEYIEPPEWIPYLPKPGTFSHPRYGEISITPERINRFIAGFKSGVYQKTLPLDAEHNLKGSGAVGWIVDMRTNEDGSADAKVDWTDRGQKLLASDRFRYISPEWYPTWTDPVTDTAYDDVAIGGALTTRPFFKEKSLRPLIASEKGLYAPDSDDKPEDITIVHFHQLTKGALPVAENSKIATEPVVSVEQFAELQRNFTELRDSLAASEEKRTEAEAKLQATTEALESSNARVAKMESESRRRQFTEMSTSWIGNKETHVSLLTSLAEAFGEESDEMAKYVEQQKALAEQAKTSHLFAEMGTSAESVPLSAAGQLEAKARKLAEETGITYPKAYEQVVVANPQLYTEYRTERRGR